MPKTIACNAAIVNKKSRAHKTQQSKSNFPTKTRETRTKQKQNPRSADSNFLFYIPSIGGDRRGRGGGTAALTVTAGGGPLLAEARGSPGSTILRRLALLIPGLIEGHKSRTGRSHAEPLGRRSLTLFATETDRQNELEFRSPTPQQKPEKGHPESETPRDPPIRAKARREEGGLPGSGEAAEDRNAN